MKRSKFLVSTAATAAVVSAIGFAYAQTNYGNADIPSAAKSADEAPAPSGNMNSGSNASASDTKVKPDSSSTSTPGAASDDSSSTSHERVARADRN